MRAGRVWDWSSLRPRSPLPIPITPSPLQPAKKVSSVCPSQGALVRRGLGWSWRGLGTPLSLVESP